MQAITQSGNTFKHSFNPVLVVDHFPTTNSNSEIQCITFFTPPRVRSLDRMEGRRPGEMAAGGRRPVSRLRLLPPGVGTR